MIPIFIICTIPIVCWMHGNKSIPSKHLQWIASCRTLYIFINKNNWNNFRLCGKKNVSNIKLSNKWKLHEKMSEKSQFLTRAYYNTLVKQCLTSYVRCKDCSCTTAWSLRMWTPSVHLRWDGRVQWLPWVDLQKNEGQICTTCRNK